MTVPISPRLAGIARHATSSASVSCVETSHLRGEATRSTSGLQRNFRFHGRCRSELSPMAPRSTPIAVRYCWVPTWWTSE
jgi:hypothetical protein